MATDPDAFVHASADAAHRPNGQNEVASTLNAVLESAQLALPRVDHVGIAILQRDGDLVTVASSSQVVRDLEAVESELQEGPSLTAISKYAVVLVEHATWETRWPQFAPHAVGLGLQSQLSIRLGDDEEILGVLNLYSTCDDFDPETLTVAELLATHAALALSRARHEEQLNHALMTRKVIGQAVGLLMGRYELDEDRAFAYLSRVSQSTNTELRDVAMDLVAKANEENRSHAQRFAASADEASSATETPGPNGTTPWAVASRGRRPRRRRRP